MDLEVKVECRYGTLEVRPQNENYLYVGFKSLTVRGCVYKGSLRMEKRDGCWAPVDEVHALYIDRADTHWSDKKEPSRAAQKTIIAAIQLAINETNLEDAVSTAHLNHLKDKVQSLSAEIAKQEQEISEKRNAWTAAYTELCTYAREHGGISVSEILENES